MSARRAGAGLLLLAALLVSCAGPDGSPPTTTTPAAPSPTVTPSPTTRPTPSPTTPAPTPGGSTVIAHDFGIPTEDAPFVTTHEVTPPVAPPPAPPLPCLREIEAGRHPDASPAYDQVSFRFSGAFPSYRISYVPALTGLGTGEEIPLPDARAVLRVQFDNAQAHNEDGSSCTESSPEGRIGFPAVASLAFAGDFEAQVVYGIGVGVSGDGTGRVRVVEVERDRGEARYVIAVQITTG